MDSADSIEVTNANRTCQTPGGEPVSAPYLSPTAEQRSGGRLQTVLRVGRVIAAGDQGLVRVRNISNEGAQLRLSLPVAPMETLTLELADDLHLRGQIVWRSGTDCGMKFGSSVDCAAILTHLATGTQTGVHRPVRLPVATAALASSEHGLRPVRVQDISQRGIKLVHDGSLNAGSYLTISLPGGIDRYGVVRWTQGNIAGVMLLEPLSAETLGSARSFEQHAGLFVGPRFRSGRQP